MAVGSLLEADDSVGVGVSVTGKLSLLSSVAVGSSTMTFVAVNVGVNTGVGVNVGVLVLVGVEVTKASIGSYGGRSKISAAKTLTESINSTDDISVVVSRIPTRFFTGTVKVSSNKVDNSAALFESAFATTIIPDAASVI